MQHVNESRTFLSPLSIGLCALALMLACFFIPSTAAHGATAAEKQKEADAITQKIDELQTQLNQANSDYDASVAKHDAAVSAMDEAKNVLKNQKNVSVNCKCAWASVQTICIKRVVPPRSLM